MTKILTIPLSLKDIQESYNQKVIIDYHASTLKAKNFFTYLKNLNMDYEIVGLEKLDFEQKKELLLFFLESNKIIKQFPIVFESYYALLFKMLNIDNDKLGFFTPDEINTLIEHNSKELKLKESFLFLTFCYPLGLSFLINENFDEEKVLEPFKEAPDFVDKIEVTAGMVSLLYAPEWGVLVANNYPVYNLLYTVQKYEDIHLFKHIMNENNDFFSFLQFAKESIQNIKEV